MEAVLPLAGVGFALGWPLEWLIQRFPRPEGSAPSVRRRWVVAALTAAIFAALTIQIGLEPELVPALLLTALVVPAAAIDLNHRIIPNLINLPGAVAVYVLSVAAQPDRWLEFLLGGLGCMLFLGVAWVVFPAGMGLGDVKMALMIGFGLGKYAFLAMFVGFMASTVLSLFLIARHGKQARKMGFPFGPFLAFGTVVALLFGPDLQPYLI